MLPTTSTGQAAIVLRRAQSDYFEHYWFSSIEQGMSEYYEWFDQQNKDGADIYFTTGGFEGGHATDKEGQPVYLEKHKGRKIANCVSQRSLFLDIDAKDQQFGTMQECKVALQRFIEASGLEFPSSVIETGGGLHAYWLCNEDIPLEYWQVFADTLSGAAKHFGLKCDTQCTVDRCRVLRVPGFINHKNGNTVDVLFPVGEPAHHYTIDALAEMLEPLIGLAPQGTPIRHTTTAPATMFAGLDLSAAMDASLKTESAFADAVATPKWIKIRDASRRGDGCALMQQVMQNQDRVGYDLWCGVLSVAKHTDDMNQAIVDTCSEHRDYEHSACVAKAMSFDGPRRCETLRSAAVADGCPDVCATCPFNGKIGSPLTLGYPDFRLKGEADVVEQRTVVQEQQPDGTVTSVVQIDVVERRALPFPYARVKGKPGIYVREKEEDEHGKITWVLGEHPLMDEDIDVTLVRDGGTAGVVAHYEYSHPMQGVQKFAVPMAALASPRGEVWPSILSNHYVKMSRAASDPIWRNKVSRFLQDIANDYADSFKSATTVEQFGPIKDNPGTFVYGDLCYRTDGPPVTVVLDDADKGPLQWADKMARPPVTLAEKAAAEEKVARWNAGLQTTIGDSLVCGPDQFVLLTGFACPLAPFIAPARQRGGMIIPNSTEAGSGKTSMVARAIQLYVSGDEGFMVPNTTKMAFLETKVSLAGALPVCWDELMKGRDDKQCELLQDLALCSSDRKPRERLTGVSTSSMWQSWFYGTMNPDPHEAIASLGGGANGAVARVMNIKVGANRFGTGMEKLRKQHAEAEFDEWCKANANVVGQRWIQHFMSRVSHLKMRYEWWSQRLMNDCADSFNEGSMRFMTTIIVSTMVAAEEAALAGLHPFNVEAVYAYAVTLLADTTEKAADAVMHDDEILPTLLNSSLDVTLTVNTSGVTISDKSPNKEIGIRIEHKGNDFCDVFITASYAKKWCTHKGISFVKLKQAFNGLGSTEPISKRMGTGIGMPSSPVRVYAVKLQAKDIPVELLEQGRVA